MAVTSLQTVAADMEGSPTIENIGSGQGGGINTDVVIEGAQSISRRVDNTTDKGIGVDVGTAVNLSGTGTHVKVWVNILQWPSVSTAKIRLEDSFAGADIHHMPTALYPARGGFVPFWLDVSRTSEQSSGFYNSGNTTIFACQIDISDVSGNAQNLIVDAISYGTSGLRWTGTGGDFDELETFENTNSVGVLIAENGVFFNYSRLEFGDSGVTTTDFTDSNQTVVFPNNRVAASDFMGLTFDGATVDLTRCTFASGEPIGASGNFNNTTRPDFIHTSGAVTLSGCLFNGFRIISLSTSADLDECTIVNSGELTNNGAKFTNGLIEGSRADNCILWNSTSDPDTFLDGTTITKNPTAPENTHAITFDAVNTPFNITLRNMTFNGYASSNGLDSSTLNFLNTASADTYNVSLINCTGNVSYKSSGAIVNISQSVSVEVVATDADTGSPVVGASVYLKTSGGVEVLNGVTDATGVLTGSFSGTTPATIDTTVSAVRSGSGSKPYQDFTLAGTISSTGYEATALLSED